MLNIVIPLAGRGSRFAEAGYTAPKPLIPVHGRPMVEIVVRNLSPARPHRFIFLALTDHLRDFPLLDILLRLAPDSSVVPVSAVTEGAACTVLLAEPHLNADAPLMIANCDQWIDASIDAYLDNMDRRQMDGMIMTMRADDPKWSFAHIDVSGLVDRVAEKEVISSHATVGVYNFRRSGDFVAAARRMIDRDLRVNGEFYVCPVYNELIANGARIGIYEVGEENRGMFGMGVPEDLEKFLENPISRRAAGLPENA